MTDSTTLVKKNGEAQSSQNNLERPPLNLLALVDGQRRQDRDEFFNRALSGPPQTDEKLSVLQQMVDGVAGRFFSDPSWRSAVNTNGAELLSSAALFAGGRTGWLATTVLCGLNNTHTESATGDAIIDFGMGAARGATVKGLFHYVGENFRYAPLKGLAMGLVSQGSNDVFQRDLLTNPSKAFQRLGGDFTDGQSRGFDAISWAAGEGLFAAANRYAFAGALARNRAAGGMVMGGMFGFINGGHQEITRQRLEERRYGFSDIQWSHVIRNGALHAALDSAAAGLGVGLLPGTHANDAKRGVERARAESVIEKKDKHPIELERKNAIRSSLALDELLNGNDPLFCRELALKMYVGDGLPKDKPKALNWMKKAASLGDNPAAMDVGSVYLSGDGIVQPNPAEALKWYQLAADRGFPDAQKYLGDCYLQGTGVEADHRQAIKWYESASELGSSSASRALAIMYDRGIGVEKNAEKSDYWYKRSQEASLKEGSELAELYRQPIARLAPAERVKLPENAIRVPLTRQATNYTCGVASLQSIMAYYGDEVGEYELAKVLKSNRRDGTKYKNIEKYARQNGYDVDTHIDATLDELKAAIDAKKPSLVLIQAWPDKPVDYPTDWNDGHYVVAMGYDAKNIYFMDPVTLGNYTYIPIDEFQSRWHDIDGRRKLNHFFMTISKPKPVYDPDDVPKIP